MRITSQRRQWKLVPILMIVDIKMAGETGAGEFSLRPTSVDILFVDQIINAHSHIVTVVIARGHQPDQGPGGLRRRAWAFTAGFRSLIRPAGLAPSAVAVLHAAQPRGGLFDLIAFHVESYERRDRAQSDQRQIRAVDVIDSPASPPRAVGLLQ